MPYKITMKIEGLMPMPVERQILGFSFGSTPKQHQTSGPPGRYPDDILEFGIDRKSDDLSIHFAAAAHDITNMDISITIFSESKGELVKQASFSFSFAQIMGYQLSGISDNGYLESIKFHAEKVIRDPV